MDIIDGIIIGAAGSIVGAIVISKFINKAPTGGDTPVQPGYGGTRQFGRPQPVYVVDLVPTPSYAAPVAQVNPITEAAYNQGPIAFEPAFGNTVGQPNEPTILPY